MGSCSLIEPSHASSSAVCGATSDDDLMARGTPLRARAPRLRYREAVEVAFRMHFDAQRRAPAAAILVGPASAGSSACSRPRRSRACSRPGADRGRHAHWLACPRGSRWPRDDGVTHRSRRRCGRVPGERLAGATSRAAHATGRSTRRWPIRLEGSTRLRRPGARAPVRAMPLLALSLRGDPVAHTRALAERWPSCRAPMSPRNTDCVATDTPCDATSHGRVTGRVARAPGARLARMRQSRLGSAALSLEDPGPLLSQSHVLDRMCQPCHPAGVSSTTS